MPLTTHVTARIPSQILIEASNDDPAPTTVDATRLGLAADDVEADLLTWAGVVYDDTNAQHISVAVDGVYLKLLAYKRDTRDVERYETWRQTDLVEGLKLVTHNNRITPKTNSRYTPTKLPSGPNNRPWFDANSAFNGLIPGQSGLRPSVSDATGEPGA